MFTAEIFKSDKRQKTGERLIEVQDTSFESAEETLAAFAEVYPAPKFRIEVHQTMVEKRNAMNGEVFMERYDTPYYCSPSSETYWSM